MSVARRPLILLPHQELVPIPAKRASGAQSKSTSPGQRLCHSPWPEISQQSGPVFTPSWFCRPTVASLLLWWVSELTAMPRLPGVSPSTAVPRWDALNCCRCVGGALPGACNPTMCNCDHPQGLCLVTALFWVSPSLCTQIR